VERKVDIQSLIVDPFSQRPVMVLRSERSDRILPICIGPNEANAIALQLERIPVPRPMTHDLMSGMLDSLGVPVKKVRITDLRNSTFYAEIVLERDGREIRLDARPSDAVALALRLSVPIFVEDSVFDRCSADGEAEPGCAEAVRRWMDGLEPKDFGRYKM